MSDSIFITGLGIVTGLGIGINNNLKALLEEKTSIDEIKILKSKHKELPVSEVKFTNEQMYEILKLSSEKIYTRTALLGGIALKEAINSAEITKNTEAKIALISGTTVGGMDRSEEFYKDFFNNNTKNQYIQVHDCGTTTELIANIFDGNFDFSTTISTACSSALNSIILAANLIKTERADIVIAGGSESLSKFHFNGFNTLMILDKQKCRPFDKTRAGLNLGEGAAFIVLESEKSVKKRNIKTLCRLLGYANTCDAYHQTATSPEGIGATMAMKKAIEKSNLLPENIDYINAHGTGTDNNDITEGIAVMNIFGENIPNISSLKSYLGHTTSAAGSVEAVLSIIAMCNNFIPANLNFNNKIDELNFSPNNKTIKNKEIKYLITNSFGFGGNDTSCVFAK